MINEDKNLLKRLCKDGLSFNEIKQRIFCSNATIKKYMRYFSPVKKEGE